MRGYVRCSVCVILTEKEERLWQDDLGYPQITTSPEKAVNMGEN